MVVNTKEALQLEVGSVLGGPLHSSTPQEVPPNLLNIDAHIHTQSAPLPPPPRSLIWLEINPGVITINERYTIPSSTWIPSPPLLHILSL